MVYKEKEMVKCDACGKKLPKKEIKSLRLKTCCSYRQVSVCKDCGNKLQKKQE